MIMIVMLLAGMLINITICPKTVLVWVVQRSEGVGYERGE